MSEYFRQVEGVVQAVRIHSDTSYSWFGHLSPTLDRKTKQALTPDAARGYLLYSMQQQLYRDFYCQGLASPVELDSQNAYFMTGMTPFIVALSNANYGAGCYEGGWKVVAVEDDNIVVRKGDLRVWAVGEDCLPLENGAIAPGAEIQMRFPKEMLNISPGFYMVLGNQQLHENESQPVIRFYWNLTAAGAVPFVQQATRRLNEARIPFRLKVCRDPVLYKRCDAAVVYIPKPVYSAVAEIFAMMYPEIAPFLKQAVPALTKLLAPGLGLAEDVGFGESFGENRCRILAEGLVRAHELHQSSYKERMQTVVKTFAEGKISLDAPFLGAGSCDDYSFSQTI